MTFGTAYTMPESARQTMTDQDNTLIIWTLCLLAIGVLMVSAGG